VDVEDLPESYCEVAQLANLLGLRKHSMPVACLPLVYREGEGVWVYGGKSYTRLDSLIAALEKAVDTWPHWCKWAPHGPLPPGVLDTELLEAALRRMPILRPQPETLAVDFVVWSYRDLADFLRSEYIHLTASSRFKERWREICPERDPRACYPGAVGELLADIRARWLVPAVDSVLFGKTLARPWGAAPVSRLVAGRTTYVYYVLGHLLREVLPRMREQADSELPLPAPDLTPIDVQGPMLRKHRKRRPEPLSPIVPIEEGLPTGQDSDSSGPFAAFDLLDL